MLVSHLKRLIFYCCVLLLLAVAACNTQGSTNITTGSPNTPISTLTQQPPQATASTTSNTASHGVPIVILSPTLVSGGGSNSQMVALPDRMLIINDVNKQAGVDASSTAIVLVMTIKNTSAKSIMNEASFFQLIGTEGDTFGLQSNAAISFFGTIASRSSRNGTIIFQIPTAAIDGLRLLYRSEIATETVFVSLNV